MLKLKRGDKIDWFRITEDLRRLGYSTKDIERATGIPSSTIKGWRLEIGSPRFETAIIVLNFWCDKTGCEISQMPVTNIYKPYNYRFNPPPKKDPKPKPDVPQIPLF